MGNTCRRQKVAASAPAEPEAVAPRPRPARPALRQSTVCEVTRGASQPPPLEPDSDSIDSEEEARLELEITEWKRPYSLGSSPVLSGDDFARLKAAGVENELTRRHRAWWQAELTARRTFRPPRVASRVASRVSVSSVITRAALEAAHDSAPRAFACYEVCCGPVDCFESSSSPSTSSASLGESLQISPTPVADAEFMTLEPPRQVLGADHYYRSRIEVADRVARLAEIRQKRQQRWREVSTLAGSVHIRSRTIRGLPRSKLRHHRRRF